jgi:hypothetical protein
MTNPLKPNRNETFTGAAMTRFAHTFAAATSLVLAATLADHALATPANGCPDAFDTGVQQASPAQLRSIAADCDDPSVAALFYNRAYHAELLDDLALLARLHRAGSNTDRLHWEQRRIYIALAETFAAEAAGSNSQIADQLNLAYEESIRIAERAINGYERMADLNRRR